MVYVFREPDCLELFIEKSNTVKLSQKEARELADELIRLSEVIEEETDE
ncbi:hypothetical protein [Bacillus anthracis]